MGGRSLRALGGVGLTNHEKALSQGSLRPLMWHYVSTTRNTHFPLSSSHQGGTFVGNIWWRENWGPDHIGHQFMVPALSLVSLGEWPTWSRPDKWAKWAIQPFINIWHYFQWLFTVVYIHHLSTYSCTKCRYLIRTISTPDQFIHMLPPTV